MKANELMLGDWVLYVGKPHYIIAIESDGMVKITTPEKADEWRRATWPDRLEPIPLTPEILEKNGFKFDGSGQRSMMFLSEPHFSEGQRFNIYVGFKHKTIEVFVAHPIEKSPNWRKTNKAYLEVCGPYIHELQNALRLCGIDKEIVL